MLVDSHCHLNFPEFTENIHAVRQLMHDSQVGHALCVSVTLDKFPEVLKLAESFDNFYASVGVHPDYEDIEEPSVEALFQLSQHPKVVAIGETGLDYFRLTGNLEWQRERFRTHIRAAILANKPSKRCRAVHSCGKTIFNGNAKVNKAFRRLPPTNTQALC